MTQVEGFRSAAPPYVPVEVGAAEATGVAALLQGRLGALTDLVLTLRHVRWNVTGPDAMAVHFMLDPQVEAVGLMVDADADRIVALGGVPVGTIGALAARRAYADYSLGRAGVADHMTALDAFYSRVIEAHSAAIRATDEVDPITQELLIEQSDQLESFRQFVRAYVEEPGLRARR